MKKRENLGRRAQKRQRKKLRPKPGQIRRTSRSLPKKGNKSKKFKAKMKEKSMVSKTMWEKANQT